MQWFQDHPRKFHYGNKMFVSTTVFDSDDFSNIIPLSRLIAHCAFTSVEETFDYGIDKININNIIPMTYKIYFLIHKDY